MEGIAQPHGIGGYICMLPVTQRGDIDIRCPSSSKKITTLAESNITATTSNNFYGERIITTNHKAKEKKINGKVGRPRVVLAVKTTHSVPVSRFIKPSKIQLYSNSCRLRWLTNLKTSLYDNQLGASGQLEFMPTCRLIRRPR